MVDMKKKIIILGGGFAGVECAKHLQKKLSKSTDIEIILVSEDNFLLFTPMLPQVASGTVQTRNIVIPIRTIIKKVTFYEGRVRHIDPVTRQVSLWGTPEKPGITLEYDYLVVALGSETNFFGMNDLENNAFRMKTLNDAVIVRNRIIDMLEQANNEPDPDTRKSLLTIVIVGGGFAGIETAGELNDFLNDAIKYYPKIIMNDISVKVLEALPSILPGFSPKLAEFTQNQMIQRGIEINLRTAVTGFDGNIVTTKNLDDQTTDILHTKTVIWTAGVTPTNTVKRSIFKTEKGKIIINEYLEADGYKGVFAAGDCALCIDTSTQKPFPPTAQLAEAQAKRIAANLYSLIKNNSMEKFTYAPRGQMAVIGKRTGIVSIFGLNIRGMMAWLLWRNVYLKKMPSMSKRARLLMDWFQDALFDRDISRLKIMRANPIKEYETLQVLDDFW
ncbi:MAG: NAD(P)/FAD-dependent oxidoreductase [Cenarchaeum sp. SB0677_bin_16]|nr:NAD(P)/FAD-dependent oxidoreductase [Cenarchaeum sp. SB0677_bin_16]